MGINEISLFIMACFYIMAGISHFVKPEFFLAITPPWVPKKEIVNFVVGFIEIFLGAMLLGENTRSFGSWGIIALLIAVFPANIYHHKKSREKGKDVIATLIRLPLQLLLIIWAYLYT